MTRDEAREAAKVLQHYADGGDVESRSSLADGWWSASAPLFDFTKRQYRIKPKPAEGWAVVWPNGCIGSVYMDRQVPDLIASHHNVARIAKFREVTE